jgi:hypothetical protein
MSQLALRLLQAHERCVLVYRMLGSSSASSGIHSTVISITSQICHAYGLKAYPESSRLFQSLTRLRSVLEEVSKVHATFCPLFILLDGLDKLQPQDECLRALWAMKNLPLNVHMVVSTVAEQGSVRMLEALLTLVTEEEASMPVQELSNADLDHLIEKHCEQNNRSITALQRESIIQSYHVQGNPLLLSLHLDSSLTWPSSQDDNLPSSADTLASILLKTLQNLEREMGSNIVSFFVAYVTAVPIGVHERELLDLMTANADVMQELFSMHGHDEDNLLFFPPSLLSVIKYELSPFLVENFVCGCKMLAWGNRDGLEAVAAQYQVIFPGVAESSITEDSTNLTLLLHEQMANMYLGESYKDSNAKSDAPSMLMPQPLLPSNRIKLQRLPIHMKVLLPLQGAGRMCEALIFNFEWLMAKLVVAPLRDLKSEVLGILLLQKQMHNQGITPEGEIYAELELFYEFLQMAEPVLKRDPNYLITEVTGRLTGLTEGHALIKTLVDGAEEWVNATKHSYLLPLCPCMPQPGEPLRHVLNGPTHFVGSMQGGRIGVFFSQKSGTEIRNMDTGELQQKFPVAKEQDVDNVLVAEEADFVIIGHFSYVQQIMELSVWSSETGVRLLQSVFPKKFNAFALDRNDAMLMVATVVETNGRPMHCLLGVDVHSKEIQFSLPTVDAHSDAITKMMLVSSHSDRLMTLGTRETKDVALWDLTQKTVILRVRLPHFPTLWREHDGKYLLAGCGVEGVIYVVDLSNGNITATVTESSLIYMRDIHVLDENFFVATENNGVLKFSLIDGTPISPHIVAPPGIKPNVIASVSDHFLFVGFDNGMLKLYKSGSGECLFDLDGHTACVNSLHVLQGRWLVSAAKDDRAMVWNLLHLKKQIEEQQEGEEEKTPVNVSCAVVSADGSEVYTAHWDGDVKVWDTETGASSSSLDA